MKYFMKEEIIMLEFKEVQTEKLNTAGTDYWVGVGIGVTIVGVLT